jgi:hypothetical protein
MMESVRGLFSGASIRVWIATASLLMGRINALHSADEFEHPPISYATAKSHDIVVRLGERIEKGEVALEEDESGSVLRSLLRELKVPESSQTLVFSKTSLQITHIGPRTPRAIYFNDDVYVGFVQGSSIMELAAMDPQLGCVFYTLERGESPRVQITRDRGQCLSCHATSRTERVPGVLVRSIYPDKSGRPRSGSSSYVSDHRSPFEQRWGGWYVTGNHGSMRHLGNTFAIDSLDPQRIDMDEGANIRQLPATIKWDPYPSRHSDLVALMVLEHQTRIHNLITRANYEARQAFYLDKSMNEALDRDPSYVSDSTRRRIANAGDALVEGLLFGNECALQAPIEGTSDFAREFGSRGPHDRLGRSLYQLDMKTRMFQYPLSYLILSDHFDGLPEPMMNYVQSRLHQILVLGTDIPASVRLNDKDRKALVEILSHQKPGWLVGAQ